MLCLRYSQQAVFKKKCEFGRKFISFINERIERCTIKSNKGQIHQNSLNKYHFGNFEILLENLGDFQKLLWIIWSYHWITEEKVFGNSPKVNWFPSSHSLQFLLLLYWSLLEAYLSEALITSSATDSMRISKGFLSVCLRPWN